MWITSFCKAVFDSIVLRAPICYNGNASKSEPVQAFHNSTEPFLYFEAEPGSTRTKDATLWIYS